ncbi:MAG: hypothetical protein AAB217_04880, partial [Chloroflexota bacterium]
AGSKTAEVFAAMNTEGLCPMPMMMHHDGQPLYTKGKLYGLLNQVRYLRKHGAVSIQITVLTPAVGTNFFDKPYEDGLVFKTIGGRRVDEAQFDGNHVVASNESKPWLKQMNLILGYASFYNPLSLFGSMFMPKRRLAGADIGMQFIGMAATAKTALDSLRWGWRLWRGPVVHCPGVPKSKLPIVKARPDEIERVRTSTIPPDSREIWAERDEKPATIVGMPLPILAVG